MWTRRAMEIEPKTLTCDAIPIAAFAYNECQSPVPILSKAA
jgi:hypothetical protein